MDREKGVRSSRWSARSVLVAAVVTAFLVAAGAGAWWWRHPEAFYPVPDTESLGLGEMSPAGGPPLHVAMAHPLREVEGSVTITGVEAHVLDNSARAQLSFLLCVPEESGSISSVNGDLSRWCSEITDLVGSTVRLNPTSASGAQVIMTISNPRPGGALRVQGIDLTYEYGHQAGTQRVGEYVWLRYR